MTKPYVIDTVISPKCNPKRIERRIFIARTNSEALINAVKYYDKQGYRVYSVGIAGVTLSPKVFSSEALRKRKSSKTSVE